MSRQRIRWIVALMAIGLLVLVWLQLYWIGSAFQLQKEQFTYKVTDALQEVVRTLERQEIQYLTKQRLQTGEYQNRLMAIAKKEEKPAPSPTPPTTQSQQIAEVQIAKQSRTTAPSADQRTPAGFIPSGALVVQSDVLHPTIRPLSAEQMGIVEEFFRQQDELMAIGDWQTQLVQQQQFDYWVNHIVNTELPRINNEAYKDSIRRAAKKRRQAVAKPKPLTNKDVLATIGTSASAANNNTIPGTNRTQERSRLVKDVLKGLFLSDRPIEDRINRLALDTLLRQALVERGINIPFSYAVRTRQQPRFLFTTLGMETHPFDTDSYKAALFPNNMLETGNYVYVYFPTKEAFILDRLGFTFAASVILILVILACFYVAISTIVKQKKLADIKNDFINNMTHEFKTPISTISLAVEMAQEQLRSNDMAFSGAGFENLPDPVEKSDSRLTRYMGIIRDENRRLGSHVEKVLQMALLDRGEIKLNLSPVNVHDVIEKVLNNLSLQIEQREGEVELNFDADRELVEADELHLTNIVYNLLDNALKYSPGSPHITISTKSLPNPSDPSGQSGVSVTVADRGLGMTKEQASRIFEKFYRVPTGNRHDVKGFGLGLSYVKKMVDEHHGQILVQSQTGKGSSFEIIIPYKQDSVSQ